MDVRLITRSRRVQVGNRDWRLILRTLDAEGALFVIDPPYPPDTRIPNSLIVPERTR